LSSQGTDASFVLTLAGFPPGFRSVLAFPTLSDSFVSDFLGAFQAFAFAFPFPAVPTLSEVLHRISPASDSEESSAPRTELHSSGGGAAELVQFEATV
ncbi:hypothetical protein ABZ605_38360, partial [Streptomyces sp. NPDC012765]|uniref:hypothetical protein n=1 Tax=Streptomyces sp. NPDC012765 TaxID=3155249 RepID=UPI0033D4D85E